MLFILRTLQKLPRCMGWMLYRGMCGGVDMASYREGETIVWSGLSSTSLNIGVTKGLLAKGTEDGRTRGTLFVIKGGWGYNIQPYSLFPEVEEEILLKQERMFRMQSIIKAKLTIIKLEVLDTLMLVPGVFGSGIK